MREYAGDIRFMPWSSSFES